MIVKDLIAKLSKLNPQADVLLAMGMWSARRALEDTNGFGMAAGVQTVGATDVLEWDTAHIYVLHMTDDPIERASM